MKSNTLLFLIISLIIIITLLVYFNINKILIGITIIILIILIIVYFSKDSKTLSHLKDASKTTTISSSKLKANKNSSNYAYSIWFYVNDWNHNLGKKKILLSRSSSSSTAKDGKIYNPEISFGSYENDININITTYAPHDQTELCSIKNFPLQTWVNLILSLNGRTADVYLDGKLVRTCLLPNVPKSINGSDVKITPHGGFAGWTSNIQYYNMALNPQQAYNIYKKGLGTGLGNLFDKYKLKFSYLVNNIEQGSVEI